MLSFGACLFAQTSVCLLRCADLFSFGNTCCFSALSILGRISRHLDKALRAFGSCCRFLRRTEGVNWVLFQGNRFTESVWLLRCDTTSFGWKQMPCARLCNCRFTLEFVTLCLCANNPFPPTQIEPLIVVWFCSMNLGTLVAVWYVDVGHLYWSIATPFIV